MGEDAGATGVQVGTLFAYCEESGFADQLKCDVIEHAGRGEVVVMTDPRASPTGYPFKVVEWATDAETPSRRERLCDLGYLRCRKVDHYRGVQQGTTRLAGRQCLARSNGSVGSSGPKISSVPRRITSSAGSSG